MFEWMKADSPRRGLPAGSPDCLAFIGSFLLSTIILSLLPVRLEAVQIQPAGRSFQITPGKGEIEVTNQIGTIRIISTNTRVDRVTFVARQLNGDSRIVSSQSASGKVTIEVGGQGSVELEVVVPALARLDLLTYKGNIEVNNHTGRIRARVASDGDILLTGLRSRQVEGHCHYGKVYFSGELIEQGTYRLKSFTGEVEVSFPWHADFKLSASTHLGGLDLGDFPLRYDRQLHDLVEAVSGSGRSQVYLWTQEGNIRLHRQL
jgi:hypothetical protein